MGFCFQFSLTWIILDWFDPLSGNCISSSIKDNHRYVLYWETNLCVTMEIYVTHSKGIHGTVIQVFSVTWLLCIEAFSFFLRCQYACSLLLLQRNLKVMISMGLSAKKEKDDRFQQIKKEVIDMVKMNASSLESKVCVAQPCWLVFCDAFFGGFWMVISV